MKNNFSEYVKQTVLDAWNGFCSIEGCYEKADDFHHVWPNTEINQELYPLFLQSPFNCRPLCRKHHDNYSSYKELKINKNLVRVYEQYLKDLKEES